MGRRQGGPEGGDKREHEAGEGGGNPHPVGVEGRTGRAAARVPLRDPYGVQRQILRRCYVHELVTMIVRSLVDEPDRVAVNKIEGERSIIFEVRVAPEDLGKVIGKGGRIANALRTVVRAAGAKERKSIWVDINKHGQGPGGPPEGGSE